MPGKAIKRWKFLVQPGITQIAAVMCELCNIFNELCNKMGKGDS
jgi:hypothetical protein